MPRRTLSSYNELIKELNSRFRVIETRKTYAARFSQRAQKPGETAEEFAAKLKRLYAKTYEFRDEQTRQEDLVRRFLDGLRDSGARFEIEYNKEPDNIGEAVYNAVNFIQTKHRSSSDDFTDRKAKKYARRTNIEDDSFNEDEENYTTDEEETRVYGISARTEQTQSKQTNTANRKVEQNGTIATDQTDALKVLTETRELLQALVNQINSQANSDSGKITQQEGAAPTGRRMFQCYGCKQTGHILRDCPDRSGKLGNVQINEATQPQGQQGKDHLN